MAPLPSSELPGHQQIKEQVDAALDTCQESQAVDFKSGQPWDTLRWKIAKAALAMGNLRGGGLVIIGVEEKDDHWALRGVTKKVLQTYDVDLVIAQINEYVSPHVKLTIVNHRRGKKSFVVVSIHEFEDTPLVCKKNYNSEGLVEGAVYVRPPDVPQTTRIKHAEQMHDLLDMAAEKRTHRFLQQVERVGLFHPASSSQGFDEELKGL